jgi:hypothetical protein
MPRREGSGDCGSLRPALLLSLGHDELLIVIGVPKAAMTADSGAHQVRWYVCELSVEVVAHCGAAAERSASANGSSASCGGSPQLVALAHGD